MASVDHGLFNEIIELASRLMAVMERENACLSQFDIKGMTALHDEKQALTRAYCQRLWELKKDPAKLAAVTHVVREEVKQIMARFDEVAKKNELALKSTKEANDRVLKAVVDAANALSQRVPGYQRNGAMNRPYGNARVPAPPPVSVNQTL